ncbi:MAG: dihydropteroate synthase [Haloarculaceae archaeon]
MEYHEAVNAMERLRRLRPKLGTETTASLLAHLGSPHEGVPAVQVAGSNGKGSTARTLERVLREAGLEVGLYTSPDLNDLRERVRVGGQKVPKREVVRFVEAAWPYVVDRSVEGDAPTFFEAFTALALWHFGREDVDVAVLEVGIGGRYDATSVVDPVAAAITSVSLEHTDLLGETVEEIARDKAHVAPDDAPLVTGATGPALATIRERTDVLTVGAGGDPPGTAGGERDSSADPDVVAAEGDMVSFAESALSLAGPDWAVETRTPLLGRHQAVNAGIAAALARQVGAATGTPVTGADIAAGVRNVHWPGRFEVMDDDPLVVLDGAHNPDACAKLAALLDRFDYEDLHLVFGAMRDKDHAAMCRSLPSADRVHLAEPAVGRAMGVDPLAAVFDRETDAEVVRAGSVLDALDGALDAADAVDCVLAAGSLYTVGEARDRWTRAPRRVRTDTPAGARAAMARADVPGPVREERADRAVGRTLRLHARRDEATDLKEAMLSLGGTAAVSGITTADEHVEVILSGTVEQFGRLVDDLRERGGGLGHVGSQLSEPLGPEGGTPGDGGGIPWDDGTAVVGVLDVDTGPSGGSDDGTHDSAADDGDGRVAAAVARAREMVEAGAAVVEVGHGSARGAESVATGTERDRVVPVVERLRDLDATLSIRTGRPAVAGAALDAGADLVTDATGLADAGMRRVVADREVPVVLADAPGVPEAHNGEAARHDVGDAFEALTERLLLAERAGIDRSRVVLDPGLRLGATASDRPGAFDRLEEFRALGCPVVVGPARRSASGRGASGTASVVASAALAVDRGADLLRVRDVAGGVAAVAAAERTSPGE